MTTQTLDLLAEAVALADAALDAALAPATVAPGRLHEAMRYAVLGGGKRVRPALVLAACRACGGPDAAARPAMAAVELLHTYTLVHDDLPAMDDDDLRRGRPTVHVAYDEATAILVGDALQCLAFEVLAESGGAAVAVLARAAGSLGVIGGQQDDLEAEGIVVSGSRDDCARLERIHRRKTAALIRASCELGARAAEAPARQRAAVTEYGEAVGLAFQIRDDILDCTASSHDLGKTAGKDVAAGKLTYVACHGLEAAQQAAEEERLRAERALADFGPEADHLRSLGAFIVGRDR